MEGGEGGEGGGGERGREGERGERGRGGTNIRCMVMNQLYLLFYLFQLNMHFVYECIMYLLIIIKHNYTIKQVGVVTLEIISLEFIKSPFCFWFSCFRRLRVFN